MRIKFFKINNKIKKKGASFFTDTNTEMDDDRENILDLGAENTNFKPLKSVPAFGIHTLISFAISLTGVILAIVYKDEDRCKAYFFMLYLRVFFWFITFIFDHVVKHHHEQLRMNGYHDFHRATNVHKGVPLYIVSLWNSAILGVQALMQHYYGPNFGLHCVESFLSPLVYIVFFSSVETVILALVNGCYIKKVIQFNLSSPQPDALRGSEPYTGSVGLTERGSDMAELLEKQSDLINYLRDHNLRLNQKLMQLHANMSQNVRQNLNNQ